MDEGGDEGGEDADANSGEEEEKEKEGNKDDKKDENSRDEEGGKVAPGNGKEKKTKESKKGAATSALRAPNDSPESGDEGGEDANSGEEEDEKEKEGNKDDKKKKDENSQDEETGAGWGSKKGARMSALRAPGDSVENNGDEGGEENSGDDEEGGSESDSRQSALEMAEAGDPSEPVLGDDASEDPEKALSEQGYADLEKMQVNASTDASAKRLEGSTRTRGGPITCAATGVVADCCSSRTARAVQ